MAGWFTVLASGSAGNASLLEADGVGLLIDCGLGPRVLAQRLAAVGRSWRSVSAVLLTHTHADHWHRLTLPHLARNNIPLVLHRRHRDVVAGCSEFDALHRAGLVREYVEDTPLAFGPTLVARPVPVPHDSDPTFAFRLDRVAGPEGSWSLGFASDVGHVTDRLIDAFTGVNVLAVEYNHDVRMQRTSRRPPVLIARVLGDHGHLSNAQGADVTTAIAGPSPPGTFGHLIQLHLSRECNTPELARAAGQKALAQAAPRARLVTATQFYPTVPLALVAPAGPTSVTVAVRSRRVSVQRPLPGLGPD